MHPYTRFLRRLVCATLALALPLLPGLLAVPLLAVASQPALGQAPAPHSQPVSTPTATPATTPATKPALAPTPTPAPAPDSLPAPKPGEVWVEVDIAQQRVRIYNGASLVKEMVASTGVSDQPTPVGSFKVQNRGEWFFSEKFQQGGFFWVSFLNWGEYLFHSVPTDREKNIIPEEAARLGQPSSHGCVRLAAEDARWIFDNIPAGSRVEIHA